VKVKCTSVHGGDSELQKHVEEHLKQGWRIEHSTAAAPGETSPFVSTILLIHSLI
jgi:hypothetical protein